MDPAKPKSREASRVSRHRKRMATGGSRRVEVTVPSQDAPLVKAIASALRSNGKEAVFIRQTLQPVLAVPKTRTGAELVAFLRASPLTGAELQIDRDRSKDRTVDLG